MAGLTFKELQLQSVIRTGDVFHTVKEWSETDWATAMAGECGEACNLIKKGRRGEPIHPGEIGKELADMVCYAVLLAQKLEIDLGEAVRAKFNEVSVRKGSRVKL